ncbi:MAG: hypothetical protein ABIJ56_16885, partial [Pseudomonadota bacterium]
EMSSNLGCRQFRDLLECLKGGDEGCDPLIRDMCDPPPDCVEGIDCIPPVDCENLEKWPPDDGSLLDTLWDTASALLMFNDEYYVPSLDPEDYAVDGIEQTLWTNTFAALGLEALADLCTSYPETLACTVDYKTEAQNIRQAVNDNLVDDSDCIDSGFCFGLTMDGEKKAVHDNHDMMAFQWPFEYFNDSTPEPGDDLFDLNENNIHRLMALFRKIEGNIAAYDCGERCTKCLWSPQYLYQMGFAKKYCELIPELMNCDKYDKSARTAWIGDMLDNHMYIPDTFRPDNLGLVGASRPLGWSQAIALMILLNETEPEIPAEVEDNFFYPLDVGNSWTYDVSVDGTAGTWTRTIDDHVTWNELPVAMAVDAFNLDGFEFSAFAYIFSNDGMVRLFGQAVPVPEGSRSDTFTPPLPVVWAGLVPDDARTETGLLLTEITGMEPVTQNYSADLGIDAFLPSFSTPGEDFIACYRLAYDITVESVQSGDGELVFCPQVGPVYGQGQGYPVALPGQDYELMLSSRNF